MSPLEEKPFAPGDAILMVDDRDRQRMVLVPEPGETVRVKGEPLAGETLTALTPGEVLTTKMHYRYLVLRPTLGEVVMNMPRAAQVIFPKDLALMLTWGDVAPGMSVIEVGSGHGALTMTLLRALGPEGDLTTFDLRQDHLNRTKKNIRAYLGEEALARWTPVLADPGGEEGFGGRRCRRLYCDVPEPWDLVPAVAETLVTGGIWLAFVPTVLQAMNLVEALREHRAFGMDQVFEAMMRYWRVRAPSVRPEHKMRGHTGFVVVCRRRLKG